MCEQQGAVADLGLGGDDDDSSEEEGEGAVASSGPRRGGVVAALRRGFIRAWPVINFSYEAVQFAYQFLYLVERTDWFSPGLQIFRLRILRLDDDDRGRLADIAANTPTWRRWLTRGMTGAALAGILTVKFFQWYYSAQADIPAKEKFIPPPPPPVEVRTKQISFAAPCLSQKEPALTLSYAVAGGSDGGCLAAANRPLALPALPQGPGQPHAHPVRLRVLLPLHLQPRAEP